MIVIYTITSVAGRAGDSLEQAVFAKKRVVHHIFATTMSKHRHRCLEPRIWLNTQRQLGTTAVDATKTIGSSTPTILWHRNNFLDFILFFFDLHHHHRPPSSSSLADVPSSDSSSSSSDNTGATITAPTQKQNEAPDLSLIHI